MARSAWKLLHIKVGLSPFLLMDLYRFLHYYSCTATTLYYHFRNIEVESNDGSHLESLMRSDQEDGYLKKVHSLADDQTVRKYSFPNFNKYINVGQVPREMLKTSAYGLGFQHLPRDLANVNAWKTMFDPYIKCQTSR